MDGTSDSRDDIYDITIIGAGPTGLFGAFYAGMRELRTKIIDALPEPGGQLIALYPEKFVTHSAALTEAHKFLASCKCPIYLLH